LEEGGNYYIDVVKVVASKIESIEEAERNGQLSVYDLERKKIIYTKLSSKFNNYQ